ncbi:hypothetical protein GGH96_002499 [Coemansia sp. RSA 1972]|nr:hypothetical protein GGH96_002499 [Coemansia sp. RSA 1972]
MLSRLTARAAAGASRPAVRGFACLSIHVNYGALQTSIDDLRTMFEQVGNVWDVRLIQSMATGRLAGRAVVMFSDGAYEPGDSPDEPPILPPPTSEEIQAVTAMVNNAVGRFNMTMVNGTQIFIHRTRSGPSQAHEWSEGHQFRSEWAKLQNHEKLFPVNPFHENKRPGDDYREGFVTGFELGLKDGSKNPQK